MKKKLLVTGCGGFVAGSVIAHSYEKWDVYTIGRKVMHAAENKFKNYNLDLLEKEELNKLFGKIKPDVVIHTAAKSDIDFCQNNQKVAESINVGITKALVILCGETGTRMILCSTDNVFDGKKGMYTEEDRPNPINFYAETKVKAEEFVRSLDCAVVARLALVMGFPVIGTGNSFLAKIIKNLNLGASIKFPVNEIRTPIDIITLGKSLVELAENDFKGTIHLSGNTRINRFEMARQIADSLGYSKDLIIGINSGIMVGRAPRPNDVSLDNSLANKELKNKMCSLIEGLELTLKHKAENL